MLIQLKNNLRHKSIQARQLLLEVMSNLAYATV